MLTVMIVNGLPWSKWWGRNMKEAATFAVRMEARTVKDLRVSS